MAYNFLTQYTTNNKPYKIDLEDAELVAEYTWTAPKDGYIKKYLEKTVDGKRLRKVILMHRLIMNAQEGEIVDHINGDTTDNRRANLRITSRSTNALNTSKPSGVHFSKKTNRWYARITVGGNKTSLGGHATKEEAVATYRKVKEMILCTLS